MSKNQDLGELINGIKSLGTNQLNAPAYTSATSFTGTLAGLLGFDSSGNIITTSASGGGVTSFNTRTGAVTLSSSDVTGALGFTPYNATNPSGFISGINSGMVTSALGYTPVPPSRTLTINGTTYDLSADRSWTVSGSSQWTTSGSNIYFTGGFVGINTSSPQYILDVSGGARFTAWSSMGINARFAWNMISDQYLANGYAGAIRIDNADGRFSFYTAPSGVAGAFPVQTERMTLTNSGSLGIGTTSIPYKLTVLSTPSGAGFDGLVVTTGSADVVGLYRTGSSYGYGMVGANQSWIYSGFGDLNILADAASANIKFGTNTSVERMRITSAGSIGINTISPTSFGSRLQMIMRGDSSSGVSVFQVVSNDLASSVAFFSGANVSDAPAIIYQKDLRFGSVTDNGLTGYTDRMRITSDGKVGIGTTSPVAMLSLPTNTSNSQISTGSIEIQSYAVNNSWIGDNIYYNGSGFVARNTGYTSQIYFGGSSGMRFLIGSSSVSAGSSSNATEFMRITYGAYTVPTLVIGSTVTSRAAAGLSIIDRDVSISTRSLYSSGGTHHEFVLPNGQIVGQITTNSSNTFYSTSSDYRLKYDYQDLQALDLIDNLKIYQYKWKVDNAIGYGVIAHELQEYLPYAVTGKKDGEEMQSVDYSKLAPIAIAGVKQLNKLFESHAEKIARLESEVAFLKSNIA
jgi:hypothetical protein